jgi:hypothetical protein
LGVRHLAEIDKLWIVCEKEKVKVECEVLGGEMGENVAAWRAQVIL